MAFIQMHAIRAGALLLSTLDRLLQDLSRSSLDFKAEIILLERLAATSFVFHRPPGSARTVLYSPIMYSPRPS
jgi:hypothetical protein